MVFNVSPTTSSFGVTIGSSTGAGAGAACGCGVCGAGVVALALALPCGGRARSGVLTGCFGPPGPETLEAFHVKTWHRNVKCEDSWHMACQDATHCWDHQIITATSSQTCKYMLAICDMFTTWFCRPSKGQRRTRKTKG